MRSLIKLALATSLFAFSAGSALADEISDTIGKAQAAYNEGKIADAKRELDMASALLAQKYAERMKVLLPAALDGWTANNGDAQSLPAAMMGGGTTVSRQYTKSDGTSVGVSILTDSPMMAMVMGLMSNPQMAVLSGSKLQTVAGQQVIIDQSGDVQAVVANRFFVTVDGSAPADDKLAYTSAIDYAALAAFQ